MNVKDFRETFSPWFDVVTKSFQDSFSKDYDINILAFLHENIDKEIKLVFSSTDRYWAVIRTQDLYNVLTYLYEHILWKLRKESFPNATLSCVKLLSQLIKTGLLLTQGLLECEYIDRILTALKLFTGKPTLLYDALLLVNGLKRQHYEPYSVILRCVLKTDCAETTDPLLYMEIILLFRRLRALSDSSDKTLYSLATKMKPPSNLISWLASLNVNDSISFLKLLKHKKIAHQLMKKNIPEPLLKTIRHRILRFYYFEESSNSCREMTTPGKSSNLFITDTSSSLMHKIQPVNSMNKILKKINSKKQGEQRKKKQKKNSVSNKKVAFSAGRTNQSTSMGSDSHVFYINNYSNLVIENELSESLQESDASETYISSNSVARTSKTVSANVKECEKSSKRRRKSKLIHNSPIQNEDLERKWEVKIISVSDSDSLDNGIPVKKSKTDYLVEQTSYLPITPKRGYSENESFVCSAENDSVNVKHRKKIKYNTVDKISNENSLENYNISSYSNFENMFTASKSEIEVTSKNSSNKSFEDDEVTFIAEIIRNEGGDDQSGKSKPAKQKSLKNSEIVSKETSKELENIVCKDKLSEDLPETPSEHTIDYDNGRCTDMTINREKSTLKSLIHIHQVLSHSSLTSDDTYSSSIQKPVETHVEKKANNSSQCTENESEVRLSEPVSERLADDYVKEDNNEDTSVKPDTQFVALETSKHVAAQKDCAIDKSNLLHYENDKPEDKSSNIYYECSKPINPSHSLKKSVENTFIKYIEAESRISQISDKTKISQNYSSTDSTLKAVNLPPQNSPESENSILKAALEKENELSTNNSKCFLSQEVSDFNMKAKVFDTSQSVLLKCKNETAKNFVKSSEKSISQTADSPKNSSELEVLNTNDRDLGNSSIKNGNEEILEIGMKCEASEMDMKLSIKNSSVKNVKSGIKFSDKSNFDSKISIKCAESDNDTEKRLSAVLVSNSSSKIDEKAFETITSTSETSFHDNKCYSGKNINQPSLVVSQNYIKSKDIFQGNAGAESMSHHNTDTGDLLQDDKKSEHMLQDDAETKSASQNDTYSLSQDKAKSEKDNAVIESPSQNDPKTASLSQEDKKSEDLLQVEADIENTSQNDSCRLSHDDVKSENMLQDVAPESSSQNVPETPSLLQESKNSETVLQEEAEVESASQSDASENVTKFKNVLQEDVVMDSSSQNDPKTDNVSQDVEKSQNVLHVNTIAESLLQHDIKNNSPSLDDEKSEAIPQDKLKSTSQNDAHNVSQADAKFENARQEDVVMESSSWNDPKTDNVLRNTEKSENLLHVSTIAESSLQHDTENCSPSMDDEKSEAISQDKVKSTPQDETKSDDALQEDVVMENSSQNDPKMDNMLKNAEKSENIHHMSTIAENSMQRDTENCSPSLDDEKSEAIPQDKVKSTPQDETKSDDALQEDVVMESSSQNDPKMDNVLQDDEKSENILHVSTIAESSLHHDTKNCSPSLDDEKSEAIPQDKVKSTSQYETKSDDALQEDVIMESSSQNVPKTNVSQKNEKSENIFQVATIVENSLQHDPKTDSLSQDEAKSDNILRVDTVAESLSQHDPRTDMSHDEAKCENILQEAAVTESSCQNDPQTNSLVLEDKSEIILQQGETEVENTLHDDAKPENILQEDAVIKNLLQNDQNTSSLLQEDKKSENILQAEVESTYQKDAYNSSQNVAKSENILQEDAVTETSSQPDPKTESLLQDDEKSDSALQSDTKVETASQYDSKAISLSQNNAEAESSSQINTKAGSVSQDTQFVNKLQDVQETVNAYQSNTERESLSHSPKKKCNIPNLNDKTVMKDDSSSYSLLTTSSSSDINRSCAVSKNTDHSSPTKNSMFTSEADSEEIDVVNISNDSETDVGIMKPECASNSVNVIKKLPSIPENKNTFETLKDSKICKQNLEQSPLKNIPKVVLSEYIPHFCKNKDYVSFSDISLQNKNKTIVVDSGLQSSNPISNFSLAATAEIFCEYRNGIPHGDKTDILCRDDVSSNTHELSDFTKSPSLSSDGSDEELDSQHYSSAEEDTVMDETEKESGECSNKITIETSDSSVLLKNNDDPVSKNETNDIGCISNENESTKGFIPDKKETNDKVLVRQSLRLRNKAEAKDKVCSDEHLEADEPSEKVSKSLTELTNDGISKISSPKRDFIPCDNRISSSTSSDKSVSDISHILEEKSSSQKSVSKKSLSVSKSKSKLRAENYISPPKGYSLRRRKSRQLVDDSSNLGIDLTKLQLDSPSCSKNTRSKSTTKDSKFAKLLTSEINSQKNSDSSDLTLSTKRETRSSTAKMEQEAAQNTPGYNLRTRTSIIAPGKLNI